MVSTQSTYSLPAESGQDIEAICIDPYDSRHLLAGFHESFDGVIESTNGGVDWIVHTGYNGKVNDPWFIDTGNPVTTRKTWLILSYYWNAPGGALWRTSDGGQTFTEADTFQYYSMGHSWLYQVGGGLMYATGIWGTPDGREGMFKSTDYGQTWTMLYSDYTETGVIGTPTYLYSGTLRRASQANDTVWTPQSNPNSKPNQGHFISTYDGQHWILYSMGSGLWRYVENSPPMWGMMTNMSVTPQGVTNNIARNVTFSLKAKDKSGGTVTNVSLDLSAVNGSAAQKMVNVSGFTLWQYTYNIVSGLSPKTAKVTAVGKTSTGLVNNKSSFFVNILPYYTGIIVTNISCPSKVSNNKSTFIDIQLVAKDLNGNITSVVLDLSPIGGPSSASMNNISGSTLWDYMYLFPAHQLMTNRRIQISATDNSGNVDAAHSAVITIVDGWPRGTRIIYKDATNSITSSWTNPGAGTPHHLAEVNDGTAFEGVKHFRYDFNLNGGYWDGFGIASDGSAPLNLIGATNLTFAYKGPASGLNLSVALIYGAGRAASIGIQLPYSASYTQVKIPLSRFVDLGHPVDFKHYDEIQFSIGGAASGTGSLFIDNIVFMGVDVTNVPPSAGMSLSSATIAPLSITNHKSNPVVVTCKASATNGSVAFLTANFSTLGGPAALAMTNVGGSNFRCSILAGPAVTAGTKTVSIKAVDNYGNVQIANTTCIVLNMPSRIWTRNMNASPSVISNTIANNMTFRLFSGDTNGSVVAGYLDLTSLGGVGSLSMSNLNGTNWFTTINIPSYQASRGLKNIPVRVVDNSGLTNIVSIGLNVVGVNRTNWIHSIQLTPSLVTNNHVTTVQISMIAGESNGAFTNVSFSLAGIGGSSRVSMSNIGGTNWFATFTVPSAVAVGSNVIPIIMSSTIKTYQTSVKLSIVAPVKDLQQNTFHITPNPLILSGNKKITDFAAITFNTKPGDDVKFEIYTILGKSVIKLDGSAKNGQLQWDGKNDNGKIVASGIYMIFMRVNGAVQGAPIKFGVLR